MARDKEVTSEVSTDSLWCSSNAVNSLAESLIASAANEAIEWIINESDVWCYIDEISGKDELHLNVSFIDTGLISLPLYNTLFHYFDDRRGGATYDAEVMPLIELMKKVISEVEAIGIKPTKEK